MSKRRLIVIGLIATIAVIAIALTFLGDRQPTAPAEATPTPTPSPEYFDFEDEHEGAAEAHQAEGKENPVLTALPENTRFWSLTFGGSVGNKYRLRATVYYTPGQNPSQKVAQQKKYITQFLDNIGQPRDTYVIVYETKQVDAEGH